MGIMTAVNLVFTAKRKSGFVHLVLALLLQKLKVTWLSQNLPYTSSHSSASSPLLLPYPTPFFNEWVLLTIT